MLEASISRPTNRQTARGKNREAFSDPNVLVRLREVELKPENQEKLSKIKSEMSDNVSRRRWTIAIGVIATIVSLSTLKTIGFFFVGVIWYVVRKMNRSKNNMNDVSYVDHFLLPVLNEVIPDAQIEYYGGIEEDVLCEVTPESSTYDTDCHIIFNDEYHCEFCNLYSHHTEEDSDNHSKEVTDFYGQVFIARYETNLVGHVRILPTTKSMIFGKERHYGYEKVSKEETAIETEDIRFNDKHNVYCTDELSTRTFLNPLMLTVLDEWAEKMPVTVYVNSHLVAVSFYSHEIVLRSPRSKREIENLSLSKEYENVQRGLRDFYSLLDTMNEQMQR